MFLLLTIISDNFQSNQILMNIDLFYYYLFLINNFIIGQLFILQAIEAFVKS